MKTLEKMIDEQKDMIEKVISTHGIDSDHTMYQLFVLQALMVGAKNPNKIARLEMERLKDIRIGEWFEQV